MDIELVHEDEMAEGERQALDGWLGEEFGHLPYEWAPRPWRLLARDDDGAIVGHVGLLVRAVTAGGTPVPVGGVGGVVVRPERRGKGVASALLARAEEEMRERFGAPFGLLLCRAEVAPVYQRAGWRIVAGPTVFAQAAGTETYPRLTMVLALAGGRWPPGAVDLCGLPW
ncbi:MAG: GNAT family N-acetyltransferase [Dehalococcoidia bacterium]